MKWHNIEDTARMFFVTGTIVNWHSLLSYETPRKIIIEDFNFYRNKHNAKIPAYVIMPDHYHILVMFEENGLLTKWLQNFHSHTSSKISKWVQSEIIYNPELEKMAIDFAKYADKGSTYAIWKEQTRSIPVFSPKMFNIKVEYIHQNPIRKGLVNHPEKWLWSSWRNYYLDDNSIMNIDPVFW